MTERRDERAPRLSRRRLLQMLGAVSVGTAGWALFGSSANAYYQGPISDHFDGTYFFNPGGVLPKGRLAFLKWQLSDRGVDWPASFPSPFSPDQPPARYEGEGARLTYIGHASHLLQTRGQNILIDPVWADRASPLSFAGPKRVNAPGIAFDSLPKIDLVLVTHNHYDHMDADAIGHLWQRFRPRIITPLGNDVILRSAVPGLEAQAVDWDATVSLPDGVAVHVERTLHWSARGTRDRRHALWASFVVEAGARKIYCVGDSGFGGGETFRRVRSRHPRACAGGAADRRLRAALDDEEQPHEPPGGRRGADIVRCIPSAGAPLGHLPPHQRASRAARAGSRRRARPPQPAGGPLYGLAAGAGHGAGLKPGGRTTSADRTRPQSPPAPR